MVVGGGNASPPAASFATPLPILTGETGGFPRNAPFPAAGISARKPVTDPASAAFFRGGWFAPPWVFGGVLTGAAVGLEGRKKERKVAPVCTLRGGIVGLQKPSVRRRSSRNNGRRNPLSQSHIHYAKSLTLTGNPAETRSENLTG